MCRVEHHAFGQIFGQADGDMAQELLALLQQCALLQPQDRRHATGEQEQTQHNFQGRKAACIFVGYQLHTSPVSLRIRPALLMHSYTLAARKCAERDLNT